MLFNLWVFPFSVSATRCLSHGATVSFPPPELAAPGHPEPADPAAEGTSSSGPGAPACQGGFRSVCPSCPCPEHQVVCSGVWVVRGRSHSPAVRGFPWPGQQRESTQGGQALAPLWVHCGQLSCVTHVYTRPPCLAFYAVHFGCTWLSCCERVRASPRGDSSCCRA